MEERQPLGYDAQILANLLREVRDAIHEQSGKTTLRYRRIVGHLYWLESSREEAQ